MKTCIFINTSSSILQFDRFKCVKPNLRMNISETGPAWLEAIGSLDKSIDLS